MDRSPAIRPLQTVLSGAAEGWGPDRSVCLGAHWGSFAAHPLFGTRLELERRGDSLDLFHAVAQELLGLESGRLVGVVGGAFVERSRDMARLSAAGEQSGGGSARLIAISRLDALASCHRSFREHHCGDLDVERLVIHGPWTAIFARRSGGKASSANERYTRRGTHPRSDARI